MLFHKLDKVGRGEAREGRLGKVRIIADKRFWSGANVCEIAPAAARYENFAADFLVVVDQEHRTAKFAGHTAAHHASSTGANNNYVKMLQFSLV